MTYPVLTYEQAERVAALLERHPLVLEVQLFGSVAERGHGNDLDLILIAPKEVALRFIGAAREEIEMETKVGDLLAGIEEFARPIDNPHISPVYAPRERATIGTLGPQLEELLFSAREVLPFRAKIDLLVLWPYWQGECAELNRTFPQGDPKFWEKIARQARAVSSKCLAQLSLL